jgi:hypothetical protein
MKQTKKQTARPTWRVVEVLSTVGLDAQQLRTLAKALEERHAQWHAQWHARWVVSSRKRTPGRERRQDRLTAESFAEAKGEVLRDMKVLYYAADRLDRLAMQKRWDGDTATPFLMELRDAKLELAVEAILDPFAGNQVRIEYVKPKGT